LWKWFEFVEASSITNYVPALFPIAKMFSQSPQDGWVVRPFSTNNDNRLPRGSGELMDVDEVKPSERNAGKHHNVKSQILEKGV
jgi:hypothetical protein